jgi:predicted nucleic acid-binding Zn ribbon protein
LALGYWFILHTATEKANWHVDKKDNNISAVIEAMFKKYRLTAKITEIKLVQAWEKIAGPLIAKHTSEIKLLNKTLYVTFDNAPLKNEMFYRRFMLLEAINAELGAGTIEKIFIK